MHLCLYCTIWIVILQMLFIFGPADMNVNVATNGLRVIDMLYCGNVPVNEAR